MERIVSYDGTLDRYSPLAHILCYDNFDTGLNGWIDLKPNFRFENFEPRRGTVDLTHWGPTMLSSATYQYAGTHGSMTGTYSMKLTTKRRAGRYEEIPAAGSMGHAVKRLSVHRPKGRLQFEMWYAYKPEQDRPGFSEKDVRAFGFLFDLQDEAHRYMPAVRYVNSVNGELAHRWQYAQAADVTDAEWEYGREGWCRRGVDPCWFGRRYPDGTTDAFREVSGGEQQLCYNESDDKLNWLYLRVLVDLATREYVELQSGDQTFDLHGISPTLVDPYANITGLLNPMVWVEADTDRRVFLYVDSIVISQD